MCIFFVLQNFLLYVQLIFISALLFHITSQPAPHCPPLHCCVIWYNPVWCNSCACLLPSRAHSLYCSLQFVIHCSSSDKGCSLILIYRMSSKKPQTIGKNLRALLHWCTSANFTFCCTLLHRLCDCSYMCLCEAMQCIKAHSCVLKQLRYSYERGWDIL